MAKQRKVGPSKGIPVEEYERRLEALRAQLEAVNKEAAFLRAENKRLTEKGEAVVKEAQRHKANSDFLLTGIRYSMDRLAAYNLSLSQKVITDNDRMVLVLIDGLMAPVRDAFWTSEEHRPVARFLPQKKAGE